MGFLDMFRRKQSGPGPTRNVQLRFLFECSRCCREKAMCFEIPLVDDQKGIYMRSAKGQSTSSSVVKLPAVLVKVDKQGNYFVEQVFDVSNSGGSVRLSEERWKDLELPIVCPYCAEKTQFVLGTCLVVNEEDGVLMQREGLQDVYGPPIGLLRVEEKGNCSVVAFLNPESDSGRTADMPGLEPGEAESPATDGDETTGESDAETIAQCGAAIQEDPRNVDAYHRRAMAHLSQQNYTYAFEDLNRAIQLDPKHAPALLGRAAVHYINGRDSLAVKDLNRAIELDSNDLRAHVNRGICYYNMDRPDLALKDLSRVLEESSDPVLTEQAREFSVLCKRSNDLRKCEKAIAYIDRGHRGNAIAELRRIIGANPDNAAAYFYLARLYDNDEDYESALSTLDRAIELDPELPNAYNNRGCIHLKTAHYTRAIADFSREIEYDSHLVAAYRGRAIAYHESAQYELAVADLKRALELSDDRKLRAEIQRQMRTVLKQQRSYRGSRGISEG